MNEIRHLLIYIFPKLKEIMMRHRICIPFGKTILPLIVDELLLETNILGLRLENRSFAINYPVISRQILESKTLDCLLVLMIDVLYLVNE